MSFPCPYCAFTIIVKTPKAGSFSPKCPKCGKSFRLTVPADLAPPWLVQALPEAAPPIEATGEMPSPLPQAQAKPAVEATGMMPSPLPKPPAAPAASVIEATGMMPSPIAHTGTMPGLVAAKNAPPAEATGVFTETPVRPVAQGNTEMMPRSQPPRPGKTKAGVSADDDVGFSVDAPTGKVDLGDMPERLGGYEIRKELGRGGMGAVYLARQVSLDRAVALKVMNSQWANDPIFLARFIREAYAAAQLVHHNVVQIYDIGLDRDINFFSMEFVEGKSLQDIVKKKGKLEARDAVNYILQAARGLKFAHDRGMIHRDIKPDNLMLNTQGIVKVADLGLVKTAAMSDQDDALPGGASPASSTRTGLSSLPAHITNAYVAMGTPAYMSPEQCADAASVDHRADIYSLGCTFYALLTGKAPFSGRSAMEVMTKHASEPVLPPEQVEGVGSVPKDVSAIVLKMMAKNPADRHADLGELIGVLESWLTDQAGDKKAAAVEEQLASLEMFVKRFNANAAAKTRTRAFQGFFALGTLAALVCLFFVSPLIAGGILGMMVAAPLTYFVLNGLATKSTLFRKAREYAFGTAWGDRFTALVGVLGFVGILYLTGLLWAFLGFGIVGAGVGFAIHFLVDRKVAEQRRPVIDEAEKLFKRMRLQGMDEEALRRFIVSNSGRDWEEFYEALFGYESKLVAREQLGDMAASRNRFAAWREPLLARIELAQQNRKEARERRVLQKIEAKRLQAEGATKQQAEEQAEAVAVRMVEQAGEIQQAERVQRRTERYDEPTRLVRPAAVKKINLREMVVATEAPKALPRRRGNPLAALANVAFGPKVRFLVGVALLVGGCMWMKQNVDAMRKEAGSAAAPTKQEADAIAAQVKSGDVSKAFESVKSMSMIRSLFDSKQEWKPLQMKLLPGFITSWFDHINPVLAGLLLLGSLWFRGALMALLVSLGAFVAFAGQRFGVPGVGPLADYQMAMAIGFGIAVVGVVIGRRKKVVVE